MLEETLGSDIAVGAREQGRKLCTDSRDGGDDFTKLQLVQNSGFTGGIETDHENSHLLLPPQLVENLRKGETHDCDWRRRGLTNVEYVK